MIPAQYWKLLAHWWWLVAICLLIGVFGTNYLYGHSKFNTFQSEMVMEVMHVNNTDGSSSFDLADRQQEASRLAREMMGPWVSRRLRSELADAKIPFADGRLKVDVQGPNAPNRRTSDVRPAVIEVIVRHPDGRNLQKITQVASQVYPEYAIERQREVLDGKQLDLRTKVDQLEAEYRNALEDERRALNEERDTVQGAVQVLLEAHDNVLIQLPVLLDDFRRQVGVANEGLAADPATLDHSINSLRSDFEVLQSEWFGQVKPSLDALYSVEAQPEVQLASSKISVLRPAYQESFQILRTFEYSADPEVVVVLEAGTTPRRVSTIGINRRYLLMFGVVMGFVSGWVLANLGEYVLSVRAVAKGRSREVPMQEEFAHGSSGS